MGDFYDLPSIAYDEAELGSKEFEIIQWCNRKLENGVRFLESQVGYDKIDQAINQIFQMEKSGMASYIPGPKSLSRTVANLIPKIAEDLTAMLTDTRYFWKYATANAKYEHQATISNDGGEAWYTRRMIDLRIGDVIRYYTFAGTGVAHVYYSNRLDDFMLEAEDPRNVFPIDPLSYHTFQEGLGVILRRARTPEWVKEEYKKDVRPDTSVIGKVFSWLTRNLIDGPGERNGPLSKRRGVDNPITGSDTVFVNTMYLRDKRKNPKSTTVYMGNWKDGKPQDTWSYEVAPGAPLYPFNRMIVWTTKSLLYDGPAPYWHAKFPVIKFTLNPWPMSWFGKAPIWDCLPLQSSMTNNLRVIDDHAAQVAQPGAVADRNVSKAEFNKFNTRAPGYKIKTNMASGKGIVVQTPPPLDSVIWEVVKWCHEMMKLISGTVDPSLMTNLGQIPSDDTIDTIMKAMTPGVRLRSRILEGAYKELAEMFLYNFWQYTPLSKRVEMFGPQAATNEDFDYAAGTGIPDDVPDGEPGDIAGMENALGSSNPRPLYQRAKAMLMSFVCRFDPSSLLNSAAQQEIMKYFLLAKMGYVSVFTLMEKLGIMNFAPPDMKIPDDEVGRLALQQQLGIGMIANAQGRKATDQAPPSMGQTGNGPTIATS